MHGSNFRRRRPLDTNDSADPVFVYQSQSGQAVTVLHGRNPYQATLYEVCDFQVPGLDPPPLHGEPMPHKMELTRQRRHRLAGLGSVAGRHAGHPLQRPIWGRAYWSIRPHAGWLSPSSAKAPYRPGS